MCSGSEAGSYLRLIDFVYHSTLDLRVIKKRRYIINASLHYFALLKKIWTRAKLAALLGNSQKLTFKSFRYVSGSSGAGRNSAHAPAALSSDDVFQETSARYRAVEPEQWLQRHPEAGSSWPSWPKASHPQQGKKCCGIG